VLQPNSSAPDAICLDVSFCTQVAATFLAPPLVGLAAFSSLHFLELLVGPKAAGLAISDTEELGAPPAPCQLCFVVFMGHIRVCISFSSLVVTRSRAGNSAAAGWSPTRRCRH
jgi:hypothetical protein